MDNQLQIDYRQKYQDLIRKLEKFIITEEKFIADKGMDFVLTELGKLIAAEK